MNVENLDYYDQELERLFGDFVEDLEPTAEDLEPEKEPKIIILGNIKAQIKILNDNKVIKTYNITGDHVDQKTAIARCVWICNQQTKLVLYGTIDKDLIIQSEALSEHPFISLHQPIIKVPKIKIRPDSYKELNISSRIDRLQNVQINKMHFSKGKSYQGYDVLNLTINPGGNKLQFTFGGKHEGFEYYCIELIKFVKNVIEKFNVNHDKIYLILCHNLSVDYLLIIH